MIKNAIDNKCKNRRGSQSVKAILSTGLEESRLWHVGVGLLHLDEAFPRRVDNFAVEITNAALLLKLQKKIALD